MREDDTFPLAVRSRLPGWIVFRKLGTVTGGENLDGHETGKGVSLAGTQR